MLSGYVILIQSILLEPRSNYEKFIVDIYTVCTEEKYFI
jgi:hypothetical protein